MAYFRDNKQKNFVSNLKESLIIKVFVNLNITIILLTIDILTINNNINN